MNPSDAAELLAICAAFDQRTIGKADAMAWGRVLGDIDPEDAQQSILDHYSRTRERIMPSDVTAGAREIARKREGGRRRAELEAQIAAENPGAIAARSTAALTAGQPIPADAEVRAERRRMLQAAAHTKRAAVEADTAQRQEQREALERARAELDARRGATA